MLPNISPGSHSKSSLHGRHIQELPSTSSDSDPINQKTIRTTLFVSTPKIQNSQSSETHLPPQNIFQSSGFWVPKTQDKKIENRKHNVKKRLKSSSNTETATDDLQSVLTLKSINEGHINNDFNNCICSESCTEVIIHKDEECEQEDARESSIVSRFREMERTLLSNHLKTEENTGPNTETKTDVKTEINLEIKTNTKTEANSETETKDFSIKEPQEQLTRGNTRKTFTGGIQDNPSQNELNPAGKERLKTSSDSTLGHVSPFQNLNYRLKTSLTLPQPNAIRSCDAWKMFENRKDYLSVKNAIDDLNKVIDSTLFDDFTDEVSMGRREVRKDNNQGSDLVNSELDQISPDKREIARVEVSQLKTRTGSLTETYRPNELSTEPEGGQTRVRRGLSLSASCLPFRPFQLQKPNLPWNRAPPSAPSGGRQESYKNCIQITITQDKSMAANQAKRRRRKESSLNGDSVRHSLPILWNSGTCPSPGREEHSCDDFSTSAESLHSISTKCSIPSIRISTFDSSEDVSETVRSPLAQSQFSSRCESNESVRTDTPTPNNKEDGSTPTSSSSSPPPPVPPRNNSLYRTNGPGSPKCPSIPPNGQQAPIDSSSNEACPSSPMMIYDFKRADSQDYVMAMIKHEKQNFQSAVVAPQTNNIHQQQQQQQPAPDANHQTKSREPPQTGPRTSNQLESSRSQPTSKKIPGDLHLSSPTPPPLLTPGTHHDPLPSPDEKLKNFVVPCLWNSSTPHDRLLISILDPRNTNSDLRSWDGFKKLLQPISPYGISASSTDASTSACSLPSSPVSPFFRSKFPPFIPEERNLDGDSDDCNDTIVDSVHTIVSNYQELEMRIKKLLTSTTDAKIQEKFSMLLEQMDTALQLIMKLTDQMTKLSSDSMTLKDHTRHNRLVEKLVEARDLKMKIDKKGEQLSLRIKRSIDQRSFEMLQFLLKARTYVTLLNRSNFVSERRKSSAASLGSTP